MTDAVEARWLHAMRQGAFEEAHAISDEVLAGRNPADADDPRLPYHLRWVWDGGDLAGRDVLVRCYHGLGDTIQFARYLPALRRRVARLTVEVQPELLRLLQTVPGPDRLIPFRPEQPAAPAERNLEIMELAYALRADAMGGAVPYFSVAAAPVARRAGLQVGLCWQGGEWDSARSVPESALAQACEVPGVATWGLCQREQTPPSSRAKRGDPEGQHGVGDSGSPRRCAPRDDGGGALPLLLQPRCGKVFSTDGSVRVRPALPLGADVMATAAVIAALDLVVTVDTMVAHLAGALGRETWLLLRRNCDWRWMAHEAVSLWYPTVRLYRQERDGDWSAPLARLSADLRNRAAAAGC